MRDIAKAIVVKQTQIAQLQSDIEALQQAATILGASAETAAGQPAPTPKQSKAKRQNRRRQWTAAEKKTIGRRMKKYWAKRRAAEGKGR